MTQPQQLRISVSGVDNDLVAPKDAIYPVSQEHGSLPADADHPVLGELHVKGTMVSLVVNIAVAVQLNGNDVALPANREVVLKHGDLVTTLPPTNVELRVRVEEATPLVGAAATATVEEDGEDELAPATSPDAVTPTLVPVTGTEAAEGGNDDNPPKTSTPASADTPNTPPAEAGAQEASMADDDNDDIVDDLNEDGDLDDGPEEGGDASEAAPANAPAAQPDPDTGGSDVTPTPNPPQADAGAQEASMADNDIVDDLDDGPEEGGDASEAAPANAPAAQPDSTP
ncbi:hypothetical protein HON52_04945, partial [Candidatus Uhrbacteria bacterium]|nr:hypothetical protein [Candidatus Uhrbacteria bacterium]